MPFLYSLLLVFLWPLVFMGFVWRYGLRRTLKGLGQRFGFDAGGRDPSGAKVIWVHAASVGEVRAVEVFLRRLPETFPGCVRLLTATTVNGRELAEKLGLAEQVRLAPLDLAACVGAFCSRWKPSALVLVETELWPNWIRVVSRRGIPLFLVNGRISDRSFRSYLLLKFLWRGLLNHFSKIGAQSPAHAARFERLGAESPRVAVTGNLKYDVPLPDPAARASLLERFGFSSSDFVWVCGSTREGEERLLAGALVSLRGRGLNMKMVLAPRHVERVPDIIQVLNLCGLPYRLRSSPAPAPQPCPPVLLLDTVGELAQAYGVARCAFVGGSLVPLGGQNPLEPARWGVPVFFGLSMENFREMASLLVKEGGALQVRDSKDLEHQVWVLSQDRSHAEAVGAAARRAAQSQTGAVEKNMKLIGVAMGRGRPGEP